MKTIYYGGAIYKASDVRRYYNPKIAAGITARTEQEFFKKYVQRVPNFVRLFSSPRHPVIPIAEERDIYRFSRRNPYPHNYNDMIDPIEMYEALADE